MQVRLVYVLRSYRYRYVSAEQEGVM